MENKSPPQCCEICEIARFTDAPYIYMYIWAILSLTKRLLKLQDFLATGRTDVAY
jgi:hypothetical protein